jgi:hypothetical protein
MPQQLYINYWFLTPILFLFSAGGNLREHLHVVAMVEEALVAVVRNFLCSIILMLKLAELFKLFFCGIKGFVPVVVIICRLMMWWTLR